jgi:hypothetical protein
MTSEESFQPKPKKRKPNRKLWISIQKQYESNDEDRMLMLETIFSRFWELPKNIDEILIEISKNGSLQLKRKIANLIASKPSIPSGLCLKIIQNIEKENDPLIRKDLDIIMEPFSEFEKNLKALQEQVINTISTDFVDQIAKQQELIQSVSAPIEEAQRSMQEFLKLNLPMEQIHKSIESLERIRIPNIQLPSHVLDSISTISRLHDLTYRSIAKSSLSYYSPEEKMGTIEELEHPLITQIKGLPPGHETWSEYQKLCESVLTFCFVPPLLDPIYEKSTEDGIHRRDIIYHIPHDTSGFWAHIKTAYNSLAIIVDAKNYTGILPKDQVVITSKYFGSKKLGNFGIIISRKGLGSSGVKQQADRWIYHDEMLVCLTDDDLIEMIGLKLASEDPERVVDKKVREFRSRL